MATTVKAIQRLTIRTMQAGRVLDEFEVDPGESFDLMTGNGHRTHVQPAALVADFALAELGYGAGDRRMAAARVERHEAHMAAGLDANSGPYGKLYE